MTTDDRCFICGLRIGRGNQPSIGLHERMNKLVSVSQTVEHSSTIISDILSRILNETVMHEETICRICFNLLNDIDYHLKEAQEKTDEITNKFLDKGKDPLSYNPQPIVMAASGPNEDILDTEEEEEDGGGAVDAGASSSSTRRFSARKEQQSRHSSRRSNSRRKKSSVGSSSSYAVGGGHDTDAPLTEDEMSVNIINKNKAKLLTHVLNPRMKVKHDSRDDRAQKLVHHDEEEVDDEEEEEEEEDDEEYYEPKLRKRRKGGGSVGRKTMRQQGKRHYVSESRSEELETVNMEDLGDLLSSKSSSRTVYFAKKSEPPPSAKSLAGGGSSKSDGAVSCELCHKMFKKRSNLQLHMEKMHVSQAPVFAVVSVDIPETHKCNLCPREFTNEKSLIAHRSDHNSGSLEAPTQQTPRAKAAKPSPSGEEGEVKATCPQCNKTFRRQFNMRIHVDRVHNKVRPFPCKFCDKTFATNSDLKQHMTVHGEGKKFPCEECGRIFTNRDSIILHRKQHSNTRSHFCKVCNKGFFKASCLNRHFRTHTGDRPYKCEHCRKGFSQSTTLKIHKEKCPKNPQHQQKGKERTILGV